MKIFDIVLALHVIGGSLSLLAGTLALILKKGTQQHRLWGQLFYYGMTGSGLASLALALLHPNVMLFCVGVFSLYLVMSGKRALRHFAHAAPSNPKLYDNVLMGVMMLFGLISISIGLYQIVKGEQMGVVLAMFGGIGLSLSISDYRRFHATALAPSAWLAAHISKMIGGYIAATTAFLVVNNTVLPALVAWLLPTVLGTVLIVKWRKKVQKQ